MGLEASAAPPPERRIEVKGRHDRYANIEASYLADTDHRGTRQPHFIGEWRPYALRALATQLVMASSSA
jgi:hypothetical protein